MIMKKIKLFQIDDGCYKRDDLSILAKEKVHIENNVLIASNVLISSGNPTKIIKKYDFDLYQWVKAEK